jgi:hypothetical protein
LHAQAHTIVFFSLGSDYQLPGTVLKTNHRVGSIAEQVEGHLLQLDTIADDRREVLGKLRPQNHPISLKIAQRQCNHFSRELVQIECLQREFLLAEERTQSRDYIGGAVGIANGSLHCFARTVHIPGISIQPPKRDTGIGEEARERLVDLVGDGGG